MPLADPQYLSNLPIPHPLLAHPYNLPVQLLLNFLLMLPGIYLLHAPFAAQ